MIPVWLAVNMMEMLVPNDLVQVVPGHDHTSSKLGCGMNVMYCIYGLWWL